MSLYRTPSPRTFKFKIAISTLGVVAAAAGSITGWAASGSVQPAVGLTQAHQSRSATTSTEKLAKPASLVLARQSAGLDAFTASPAPREKAQASPLKPVGARHKPAPARLTPKQIARQMLSGFRWGSSQFQFLNLLWSRESSWNVHAANPYSGAYGIPQAVPGAKMSSAGPNWPDNARTQIRWGLRYIKDRYGSPHAAWDHEMATGWY